MKTLTAFLISSFSAAAIATPTTLATYQCATGSTSTVRVLKDDNAYTVAITYTSVDPKTQAKHVVNIMSAPDTIEKAAQTFGADLSVAYDALPFLTQLPPESVAFTGFHYPNGEMYVITEGDSNEEGYVFSADKALLNGGETAETAELFWSEFHAPEVSKATCTRLN